MYKYYKEVLSFYDIMALSNCLHYISDNNESISDDQIVENIENGKVDLSFIKELITTQKFSKMQQRFAEMKHRIKYYSKYTKEELIEMFLKYTENNILSYMDIALVLNELNKKIRMINNDVFLIKYVFYHDSDLYFSLEKLLNDMPNELRNTELNTIIESKFTVKLLKVKKLETFSDIQNLNMELLYLIFLEDIEKLSCIAETYLYIINDIESFHRKIEDMIWKPNEIFVIDKRYSIDGINPILINPLYINRGLGKKIIREIISLNCDICNMKPDYIYAGIDVGNIPSKKIFVANGFELYGNSSDGLFNYYKYLLKKK